MTTGLDYTAGMDSSVTNRTDYNSVMNSVQTEGLDYIKRDVANEHCSDCFQNELEWPQETFFYNDSISSLKNHPQTTDSIKQSQFPSWAGSDQDRWRINSVSDPVGIETIDHVTSMTSSSRYRCDSICRKFVCGFFLFTVVAALFTGTVLFFLMRMPNDDVQTKTHHEKSIYPRLMVSEQEYLTSTFCDLGRLLLQGADYPTDSGVASCHAAFSVFENMDTISIEMQITPVHGLTLKEPFRRALKENILVDGVYRVNGTTRLLHTDGRVWDSDKTMNFDTPDQNAQTPTPHSFTGTTVDTLSTQPYVTPTTKSYHPRECRCSTEGNRVESTEVVNHKNLHVNASDSTLTENEDRNTDSNHTAISDKNVKTATEGHTDTSNGTMVGIGIVEYQGSSINKQEHIDNALINDHIKHSRDNTPNDSNISQNIRETFNDMNNSNYMEQFVGTLTSSLSRFESATMKSHINPTSVKYEPTSATHVSDDSTSESLNDYNLYLEMNTDYRQKLLDTTQYIQPSPTLHTYTTSMHGSITKLKPTTTLEHTTTTAAHSILERTSPVANGERSIDTTMLYESLMLEEIIVSSSIKLSEINNDKYHPTSSIHDLSTTPSIIPTISVIIESRSPNSIRNSSPIDDATADSSFSSSSISKPPQSSSDNSTSYSQLKSSSEIPSVYMSTAIPDRDNMLLVFKDGPKIAPLFDDAFNQLDRPSLTSSSTVLPQTDTISSTVATNTIEATSNYKIKQEFHPGNKTLIHTTTINISDDILLSKSRLSVASASIAEEHALRFINARKTDNEKSRPISDLLYDDPPPIQIPATQNITPTNIPKRRTGLYKSTTQYPPVSTKFSRKETSSDFDSNIDRKKIAAINLKPPHITANTNREIDNKNLYTPRKVNIIRAAYPKSQITNNNMLKATPQVHAFKLNHFNPLQVLMKLPGMNFQFG